jgi:hypothetical protein
VSHLSFLFPTLAQLWLLSTPSFRASFFCFFCIKSLINKLLKLQPFWDLELKFIGSRRQEQLSSRCQQRVVATVEESVLRMEMAGLESQEEDVAHQTSPS